MLTKIEWFVAGFLVFLACAVLYALVMFTIFLHKSTHAMREHTRQTNVLIKDHDIARAQHEARNNKQVELVKQLLLDHQQLMEKVRQ